MVLKISLYRNVTNVHILHFRPVWLSSNNTVMELKITATAFYATFSSTVYYLRILNICRYKELATVVLCAAF